jgi:hypothetical protein
MLVAALGLVVALVLVPAGPAAAATMTVTTRDSAVNPQLVSTTAGRVFDVDVHTDSNATNVHVVFSGTGLTVDTPDVDLGNVNGSERASVEVTATSGGLHTLNIQVTSNNSSTVNTSLPFVWAPGGTPIPANGDLTGRNYGNVDLYTANGGNSYEDRQMLSFLDGELAFIGPPSKGRPVCTSGSSVARKGCVTYRYDTATGLVQIGGAIGHVTPKRVYVEGIGIADDSDGELYNHRTFAQRIGYPSPGKTYAGSWHFSYSQFLDSGPALVKLTLNKNGTFSLKYGYGDDDGKVTTRTGTYALVAPGRLRLKGTFGSEIHTFAVRTTTAGKAKPAKGIWFTLGTGKHTEAVPMKPGK